MNDDQKHQQKYILSKEEAEERIRVCLVIGSAMNRLKVEINEEPSKEKMLFFMRLADAMERFLPSVEEAA